ncbi:hypothetical protein ACFX2J_037601 [Malus domestica]
MEGKDNKGGIGVVIKSDEGRFLAALSMHLDDIASPWLADLEAARAAITLVKDLQNEQLELQGDAALVLAAFNLHAEDDTLLWGNVVNEARFSLRSIP